MGCEGTKEHTSDRGSALRTHQPPRRRVAAVSGCVKGNCPVVRAGVEGTGAPNEDRTSGRRSEAKTAKIGPRRENLFQDHSAPINALPSIFMRPRGSMSVYDRPVVGICRGRLTGDTSCGVVFANKPRVERSRRRSALFLTRGLLAILVSF